jgi:hypothetical protein
MPSVTIGEVWRALTAASRPASVDKSDCGWGGGGWGGLISYNNNGMPPLPRGRYEKDGDIWASPPPHLFLIHHRVRSGQVRHGTAQHIPN